MTSTIPDEIAIENILVGLSKARAEFLELHRQVTELHPEWVAKNDARTNLLAKPVNHILIAAVNLRLVQRVLQQVAFWQTELISDLNTPQSVYPAYFEQNTFYRFGFFVFLITNIEHGFRAIQPKVVQGVDRQADQPFAHVYSTLYRAVLPENIAAQHIELFDFLRTLRNTIHNNGVYSPTNRKDTRFVIAGKTYDFVVGRRAEYFTWQNFVEWLSHIREALSDLINSPAVMGVDYISDVASHS